MPITFAKAYVANGKTFATLQEAQVAELDALFTERPAETASLAIIRNIDKVLDILTTTDSSRPLARRVNGGKKPRKSKAAPTAEAATTEELPIQSPQPQVS